MGGGGDRGRGRLLGEGNGGWVIGGAGLGGVSWAEGGFCRGGAVDVVVRSWRAGLSTLLSPVADVNFSGGVSVRSLFPSSLMSGVV